MPRGLAFRKMEKDMRENKLLVDNMKKDRSSLPGWRSAFKKEITRITCGEL